MRIRQLIVETYLYVLAFALLAIGLICIGSNIWRGISGVQAGILSYHDAIASMMIGVLLLCAVCRLRRAIFWFNVVLVGVALYALTYYYLMHASDVARAFLTDLILWSPGTLLIILVASSIAVLFSQSSLPASWLVRSVGAAMMLFAAATNFSSDLPIFDLLNFAFKESPNYVANLFTFLVGGAVLLFTFQDPECEQRLSCAPLMAGMLGATITCGSWYLLSLQAVEVINQRSDLLLSKSQSLLEDSMRARVDLISRLVKRWEALGTLPSEVFWQTEAWSYLRDFPSLNLIAVLDDQYKPYWLEARSAENEKWLRKFLVSVSHIDWLHHVSVDPTPHVSRAVQNPDGVNALIASSLHIRGESPRLVVAILDMQKAVGDLLGEELGGFVVKLYDGDTTIFNSRAPALQLQSKPVGERFIDFHHDQRWRLVSYFDDSVAPSSLPALLLSFGLLLSFFVMLSQRLASIAIAHAGELLRTNEELQLSLVSQLKTQALNQRIMGFTQDVLCSFDSEGRFLEVSISCIKLFGYQQQELIGTSYLDLLLPEDYDLTRIEVAKVKAGLPSHGFRNRYRHRDGRILHILWSANWSEQEQTMFAVAHNITPMVHNEALIEKQRDILGMISVDRPQYETLDAVCHMVEAQEAGTFCSVLLLDASGNRLKMGVAPSLPESYTRSIDGVTISSNSGSCGTAAYLRKLIVVEDIEIDPLWADHRHLARPYGLRACWSFPLISHNGQVLGTFATYRKEPGAPSANQTQHLAMAAHLAAVTIARTRDRQLLQESEQRFRSLFTFNPDPVFAFDLKGQFISMNEAGEKLTGIGEEQILGRHFAPMIASDDRDCTLQHFASACCGIPQRYEVRIRDAAGGQLHLDVSNLPIMVEGEIVGVFGLAKDITERERIAGELNTTLARSKRQAEQLCGLGAAAITTARLHDLQTLIDYLVEQVRLVIGAHQVVLSLTRGVDWSQSINGFALSDKYAAWREYTAIPDGSGIYALICETNQPLMLTQEELEQHPRWRGFSEHAAAHPPLRGWLAVPLIDKAGGNLGLLQLSDKIDGEFDADDLNIVQQFAQMAVSCLENSRLLNEVMAAEQRLKAQLDFTSSITDCLAEGLLAVNEQGVLTFANPAARGLLAAGQEPVGLEIQQFLPLDLQNRRRTVAYRGELELRGLTLHYDARPLMGLAGAQGWVVALRDISVQRRAEQAMRERNQFFSLSLDLFSMVNLQGLFIQVNPAFANTLHFNTDALIGKPYMRLIHTADRERVLQAIEHLQDGKLIHDLAIRVWDGLGNLHWLQLSAAMGEDRVIYCAARDITEHKAIQDQVAQRNLILSMAGKTARLGGWSIELPSYEVVWSDEMFDLLGFERGSVPALKDGLSLYSGDQRVAMVAALDACICEGQAFDLDVEIRHASGMLLDARVAGQAVRDGAGNIVRVSGALQDISERKQAQREVQRLAIRLANTLESITDAFFTLDTQWCFSYANQEAARQLRLSVDEMLGNSLWEIFPDARESEFGIRYLQAVQDHEAAHFESYYAPLARWFEVHAYPSEEGLAVYFRDVSERRRTEEELQATLIELERSNSELQEFAFVASHDLQEPLRKIQAFSDRLAVRANGLDEEGRDYLQRMASAASRMQALIVDLLNYSRVNTRGQLLQPVELERVLDEVLLDMEAGIEQAACLIDRQPLPAVLGDVSQLRQVIQNLLSNALKFQVPGNTPLIRIYGESIEGDKWTLCIADNGIGFDEKYLDRIFNPFQRLHGRDAYSGTGIGLAIVKKIIERHNASITASSKPGQGSVFRITFPRIIKDSL